MMNEDVHAAYELMVSGRHGQAYGRFVELACTGDGWAALYAGWMHHQGLGRAVDCGAAEQSYKQALEFGVPDAAYYLGTLYREQQRYSQALEYFDRAARSDNPSAAYWAYRMLARGEGVPQDDAKAAEYLKRAAQLGHVYAARDLARRTLRSRPGFVECVKALCAWIANGFRAARLAGRDPNDYRIR